VPFGPVDAFSVGRVLWRWYAAIGAAAIAGYPLIPVGLGQDAAYVALGASSVVAIVVGVRLHEPTRRAPWYLMAAGQLLWVIGDAIGSWFEDVEHIAPFPSVADGFYLAAYPILAVGLVLLIRGRRPTRDIAGLLDSATLTAGLGLLSWVLLARPTLDASQQSVAAASVSVAYPLADILLAGVLIRLVTTPGGRTLSLRLLLVAVALLIAGDSTSAALSLFTSSSTNNYDVIWLASYLAWGMAALHPSMRSLSQSSAAGELKFTRGRLVALTLAVLVAPGILTVQRLSGSSIDVWAIVTGSVVMFVLVVSRMNLAIVQIVSANRERERLQDHLVYQAAHDSLTELPNRAQAMRMIEAALSRGQRSSAMTGLLFVDLDGFKAVNDNFGHRAGDDVLRCVAQRMQDTIRGGDVVARLGGDEFIVLLEPLDTESSAVDVAERIVLAASAPITTAAGDKVRIGASVGIAISHDGFTDPEQLLNEADVATYRAKAAGRGRAEVFDESLRRELSERLSLEHALVQAIGQDELVLHYQPIIEVATGRVEGFEALVRWRKPGDGLVPPAQFIAVAEASDLICDLDAWVLDHATRQLAEWSAAGVGRQLTMAVNISGRHIANQRVVTDVARALARSGVAPRQLVLEITETVFVDTLVAIEHLEQLRRMGVAISLDDFGTGYNSISRVRDLPIDIIKIDKTFVDSGESSDKLLALMVQAAHTFGLPVVAEGVEHAHQLEALEALGCESAQGFYIGAPMTAEQALSRLADNAISHPSS
jgi:diguanylate cyclase (GGDEF)-like protein